MARLSRSGVMWLMAAVGAPAVAGPTTFHPLGFLDDGTNPPASFAYGLSTDGSIIVGGSAIPHRDDPNLPELQACMWGFPSGGTPTGPTGLATNFAFSCAARAVSDDGTKVVGVAGLYLEYSHLGRHDLSEWYGQYWWDLGSGNEQSDFAFETLAFHDMTPDGAVAVGQLGEDNFGERSPTFAFSWTGPGQAAQNLGAISGWSLASAVADGGDVIFGFSGTPTVQAACNWDDGGGPNILTEVPDDRFTGALGCSSDGEFVVGLAEPDSFRWSAGTGYMTIPRLSPSPVWFRAFDVSLDGSIVVGQEAVEDFDTGLLTQTAFIWREGHGTRALKEWLQTDHGVDLTKWSLASAEAISDDGSTIVGWGKNPGGVWQGFVVRLGASCPADMTGEGEVNSDDFIQYLVFFAAGDPRADVNGVPGISSDDFIFYLGLYAAGCP